MSPSISAPVTEIRQSDGQTLWSIFRDSSLAGKCSIYKNDCSLFRHIAEFHQQRVSCGSSFLSLIFLTESPSWLLPQKNEDRWVYTVLHFVLLSRVLDGCYLSVKTVPHSPHSLFNFPSETWIVITIRPWKDAVSSTAHLLLPLLITRLLFKLFFLL